MELKKGAVAELSVGTDTATSTATTLLDSGSVVPTCTPLPITDQYDCTTQEHSTCSAARFTDTFYETPPPPQVPVKGSSSQEESDSIREKDSTRRPIFPKLSQIQSNQKVKRVSRAN